MIRLVLTIFAIAIGTHLYLSVMELLFDKD